MKMGPARHDVLKNLPAAAVGDETQLQAEVLGKLQHGHMGHVAGRGDAHDVLVGVLFRHFDKFVDVLPRGVFGGHQNHGLADGCAYEVERIRPVGKLHHMRLQTHGPGGHIAERVAVRFGGGHLRHPERAARAGNVLHDDGLSKPLFRPYCRIKKPNTTIMAACPAAEKRNAFSTLSVISIPAIVVISIAGIVTRMTILPTFLFVSIGKYPFLLQ
jgi:hypothetical protein